MNGLDIVITSYNTRELLARCLESLRRFPSARPMRITVIDNGSDDGSADMVRAKYPEVELMAFDCNRGYGPATNHGLRHLQHETVLLLNGDTEITAGCLDLLQEYLDERPEVAVVGPRQLSSDGRSQLSSGPRPTLQSEVDRRLRHRRLRDGRSGAPWADRAGRAAWVSGSAMMIRREALRRTGLFDENFFLYFEDIDLCLRAIAAGCEVHYLPAAAVLHQGGASAAQQADQAEYEYRRSQLLFWAKHGRWWERWAIRGWVGWRSLLSLTACRLGWTEDRQGRRSDLRRRVLRLAWRGGE